MTDTPNNEEEEARPVQMMQPARRNLIEQRTQAIRAREPIQRKVAEAPPPAPEIDIQPRMGRREVDPLFAYLFIVSLGIGLSPLEPLIRFVILWGLMGGLGMMGYLLGAVDQERAAVIDDFVWGIAIGFLTTFPFFLVFGDTFETISRRMFDVPNTPDRVMDTWVFMAVVFVLPAIEALFFRGAMQTVRSLVLTAILGTIWACILFFPHMELGGRTAVGIVLVFTFGLLNFMYSYVQFRNGLAASWLCQSISYSLLWFLPRLI